MGFRKGKQRIELRKIEKQSSLHATFSKRRTGLFKKANELTVLCGSEVAALVFSPAGKVFTFGHPDANAVINRFLAVDGKIEQLAESTSSSSSSEKDIGVKVEELSRRSRELDSWIEEEKKRLMVLNEINGNLGTMKNLDDLGLDRLMGYEKMMMEMKNQLAVIIANGHCPIDDDLLLNDDFKLDRLIGSVDLETCAKILMSDSDLL